MSPTIVILAVFEAVLFFVAGGILFFTRYNRLGVALSACWLVAFAVLLLAIASDYAGWGSPT